MHTDLVVFYVLVTPKSVSPAQVTLLSFRLSYTSNFWTFPSVGPLPSQIPLTHIELFSPSLNQGCSYDPPCSELCARVLLISPISKYPFLLLPLLHMSSQRFSSGLLLCPLTVLPDFSVSPFTLFTHCHHTMGLFVICF